MQDGSRCKCMQPAFVHAGPLGDVQGLTSGGSSAVAGRPCNLCHCPQLPPTRSPPLFHKRPAHRAGAAHAKPRQRVPAGNLKGCKGRLCNHAHCASAAHAVPLLKCPACRTGPFARLVRAEGSGNPALQPGQSLAGARLGGASAARTALVSTLSTGMPNLHDILLTAEHVPMLCLEGLCHASQPAKPCRTVLADTLLLLQAQSPKLLQDLGCTGGLSGETPMRSVLMLH